MGRGRTFLHIPAAFCHEIQKRIHGGERLLLAQFLIVALQRPLDEFVDWLASAFGQSMGEIPCFGVAHRQLWFATSLRRRPPEAKASIRIVRSRKAVRFPLEQIASSLPRISPMISLALLRLRGPVKSADGKIADLTAGEENAPSSPRHRASVDQLARRRRTVAGACGSDTPNCPS